MLDTAQLLIFIRGINYNFEITEELRSLERLSSTTTGEDLFKALLNTLNNLSLSFKNLVNVTIDGVNSMVGSMTGLIGIINTKISELNLLPSILRSQALNRRQFQNFLLEIESEYKDVLYYNNA